MSNQIINTVVMERIQKRIEEAKIESEKLKQEKDKNRNLEETQDFFFERFNEVYKCIENDLNSIEEMEDQRKISSCEMIQSSLNNLNKYFTNSTHFLSPYNIRITQLKISKMDEKLKEIKNKSNPPKKFGFKKTKKSGTKKVENKILNNKNSHTSTKENQPEDSLSNSPNQFLAENTVIIKNKQNEEINLNREAILKKDINITSVSKATIRLKGSSSVVQMVDLNNCQVFIGPVDGSIFIESCQNCVFHLICQQLRIHKTKECQFFVHITSRSIIEDTSKVSFAPFTWTYEGLEDDFKQTRLNREVNNWNQVDDFDWLVDGKPSPNWTLLQSKESNKPDDINNIRNTSKNTYSNNNSSCN